MAIEISNNWPLITIKHTRETSLQEKTVPKPPSQDSPDTTVYVERIESESNNTFWEKGTFIDIYI